jgi:hypothetical protein
MAKRLKRVAARFGRRTLSILLILAFLAGSTGFPFATYEGKDHSQPFPCQDNPCGCSSAEECWHHCCCHTNREKVAWAREHGVTPPEYVVKAARKEEESSQRVCCRHAGCPSCAAKTAHHRHDESPAESASPVKKGALRFKLVVSDLARQCRGLSHVWSVFAAALPAPISPAWSFDETIVGRVVDRSVLEPVMDLAPPVPPPKLRPLCG